jgi:predicted secreted protein
MFDNFNTINPQFLNFVARLIDLAEVFKSIKSLKNTC